MSNHLEIMKKQAVIHTILNFTVFFSSVREGDLEKNRFYPL